MKILLLTPWYPNDDNPDYGIFVRNMALALSQKNQVQVIFSKIDYSSFGFCSVRRTSDDYENVNEYRLYIKRSLPIYNQLNFFLITIWYTWKVARRFKPDLIHANISYPGGFWAWVIALLLRKPYVMTEHTRFIHNFRSSIQGWLAVFSVKRASAVHTVSTRMAEEITSITGKRCYVVPNIVVINRFIDVTPAPPGVVTQVGFLGGLDRPIKGLDILLKALKTVKSNYTLHIGGSGELETEYKSLALELGIADHCIFYGTMHHWEVPEFMGRLNFFVNASRFESFGIAVLEAVACGLPVIATRCGGPEDFVTNDCGILVPPEDIEKLGEAINWMIDHYLSFDQQTMKDYVSLRFSPAVIADEMEAVYASAIHANARA